MSTNSSPILLMERDDPAPQEYVIGAGSVVAFSRRSPEKPINEDGAAILPHPQGGVLIVADGMGGQSYGDRATRATLETLANCIRSGGPDSERLRSHLLDGIEEANRAVQALGVGAGATLAAVVLREGVAQPVHVGDSMVLHVGQRGLVKSLTIPHSPTGYAVEAGLLEAEAALHHDDRHVVSNFVGFDGMRIELGAAQTVRRHDTLLIASDGLADNLRLEEIVEIVRKGPLGQAAQRLAALATQRMRCPALEQPSKPDDLTFLLFRRGAD
jgi:serine/threonine protein phosphatase PrpC